MGKSFILFKIKCFYQLNPIIILFLITCGLYAGERSGESEKTAITTVHQDFSEDPGWEGHNNWVECEDAPQITQDFGWSSSNRTGEGPGEIGGTIWRSTVPAYYAMPVGPYDFTQKLTASGKFRAYGLIRR